MNHLCKTSSSSVIAAVLCGAAAFGCAGAPSETEEIIDNLLQAGFPADDIMVVGDTVYVGRDAEVSLAASREMLGTDGRGKEQYRTNNLVDRSIQKICVDGSTFTGVFSTALDLAIENYDEQALSFAMARTPSSGCSFTINAVIAPGLTGGSAGFPSGGLPFGTINIGDGLASFGVDTIEHVITHELGHTIGFRHSDFFNRSISCGSGGNEGDAGIGANLVPGTPSDAVVGGSLMNSCFQTFELGEFTVSDIIGLIALYTQGIAFRTDNGHFLVAESGGGSHVAANRTGIGAWERFALIDVNRGALVSGDVVNLRAFDGLYVVAENGGGGVVNANRLAAGPWEEFRILNLDGASGFATGSRVALQASNGQFVVAENGGGLAGSGSVNANRNGIGSWETFVITLE